MKMAVQSRRPHSPSDFEARYLKGDVALNYKSICL
jgi:hypothetical protein